MSGTEFQNELTQIFAEADAEYGADRDAFIGSVNKRITRHIWLRRGLLACATLFGAVFVLVQVPGLFSGWPDLADLAGPLREGVRTEAGNVSMTLFAGIAIAVVSLIATLSFERL